MAITFPNSPSSGDTHTTSNGLQYTYDGEKWTTIGTNSAGTWTRTGTTVSLTTATDDLNVDSGTLFVDASTNRVGVGTSSPSAQLHVRDSANYNFTVAAGNSTTGMQVGNYDATDGYNPLTLRGSQFLFRTTGGNERLRIDSSGRLGLGTSSPEGVLSVYGTAAEPPTSGTTANSLIQLKSNLTTELNIGLNTVTGNYGAYIQASDNNLAVNYPLHLQPNGGNVGIGTTSISSNLHIRPASGDDSAFTNGVRVERTNTAGQYVLFNYTGGAATITAVETTASNPVTRFLRSTNGSTTTESLRVDGSGRLLVGTTTEGVSGGDNFTIAATGNNHAGMTIRSGTSTRGSIYFSDGTSGDAEYQGYIEYQQGTGTATYMRFGTAAIEQLRINGIGRLSGHGVNINQVFALLYARMYSHSNCNAGGPSASFTDFDNGLPAFTTVTGTVSSAPTNYSFIGDNHGNAFTLWVGCGGNALFGTDNASNNAPGYKSWVCVHNLFVAALFGLPTNATRTSLP